MKTILLSICLLWSLCIAAQTTGKGTVSIAVRNQQQNSVEGATVELLQSKDSALVKAALTDKTGSALFDNIDTGTYIIRVVMTSYAPAYTPPFTTTATQPEVKLF